MCRWIAVIALAFLFAAAGVLEAGPGKGKGRSRAKPGARGDKGVQGIEMMFQRLDADKDGTLSQDELQKLGQLRGKGDDGGKAAQRIGKLFQRLDANNNGSISKEEFKNLGAFGGGKGKAKGGENPRKRKKENP